MLLGLTLRLDERVVLRPTKPGWSMSSGAPGPDFFCFSVELMCSSFPVWRRGDCGRPLHSASPVVNLATRADSVCISSHSYPLRSSAKARLDRSAGYDTPTTFLADHTQILRVSVRKRRNYLSSPRSGGVVAR